MTNAPKYRMTEMKSGLEGEVGVERPLSPSLFTSCQLANKCKVERGGTWPSCGWNNAGWDWWLRLGCLCGLALPRLMPPIFMQVCVIEIIDEKMRHFLWDTPLLMICQTVHTADFMFCSVPDTLTATEYDSVLQGFSWCFVEAVFLFSSEIKGIVPTWQTSLMACHSF